MSCSSVIAPIILSLELKTTFTEAIPTFYKLLQDYNIPTSKFNSISDQQLDLNVSQIKTEHPNVGEVMLMGHLHSKHIVVQRRRVRDWWTQLVS